MACLAFVYFTITVRDGVHTVHGHVKFCYELDPEEIPPESWATCEYCPDVIWTTYLLESFRQLLWQRARYTVLSFRVSFSTFLSGFLGADVMLSGLLLQWKLSWTNHFFFICINVATNGFLLDVLRIIRIMGIEIEVLFGEGGLTVHRWPESLLCVCYLYIEEGQFIILFFLHSELYRWSDWVQVIK